VKLEAIESFEEIAAIVFRFFFTRFLGKNLENIDFGRYYSVLRNGLYFRMQDEKKGVRI